MSGIRPRVLLRAVPALIALGASGVAAQAASAAPQISALSQTRGINIGGSPYSIYGSGFTGATAVTMDSAPVVFTVVSDTRIEVRPGMTTPGDHSFRVTVGGVTSADTPADNITIVGGPGRQSRSVNVTCSIGSSGPSLAGSFVLERSANLGGTTVPTVEPGGSFSADDLRATLTLTDGSLIGDTTTGYPSGEATIDSIATDLTGATTTSADLAGGGGQHMVLAHIPESAPVAFDIPDAGNLPTFSVTAASPGGHGLDVALHQLTAHATFVDGDDARDQTLACVPLSADQATVLVASVVATTTPTTPAPTTPAATTPPGTSLPNCGAQPLRTVISPVLTSLISSTTAHVSWGYYLSAAYDDCTRPDPNDPAQFQIYNGSTLIATVPGSARAADLTGLAPNTTYTVTVTDGGVTSEPATFTTAVSSTSPPPGGACASGVVDYAYDIAGSATLKTLTRGSLTLRGSIAAHLCLADGNFTGDLALPQTTGNLTALGFLPVTATVNLVPTAQVTGNYDKAAQSLKASAKVRIKLPSVKLAGIPIGGGANCQASQISTIPLGSVGVFNPLEGGQLAGSFSISNLTGCGALNGIISPLTSGSGNAIALKLTRQG